jgi:hypothetical protein
MTGHELEIPLPAPRTTVDGTRKRRFSQNPARRHYYSVARAVRFARRMWDFHFPSQRSLRAG